MLADISKLNKLKKFIKFFPSIVSIKALFTMLSIEADKVLVCFYRFKKNNNYKQN